MGLRKATLYDQSIEIERICERLRSLDSSFQTDVSEVQKILLGGYKENPVFDDAVNGVQSIEESVRELGEKNRGIRKIIPWRKDPAHNERLKHLGELVSEPGHLQALGILYPDNVITAAAEMAAVIFVGTYLLSRYLFSPLGASPEEYQQTLYTLHVVIPSAMSAFGGLFSGFMLGKERLGSLPIKEAKYLDERIKEF